MNARRIASMAGTVAVTVVAAIGSYDHMRTLALEAGQTPFLATLLPLSVDGMILVATLALGDARRSRWSAWLAFLVGVAASLAANVIVAAPDAVARVVSAWPAVALLLTVEVLARSGKGPAVVPAEPVAQPQEAAQEAPEVAAPSGCAEESAEGPSEPHSGSHSPEPEQPRRKRRPAAETRRLAAVMLAEPGATRERVASALGITPRRLRQVLNMA